MIQRVGMDEMLHPFHLLQLVDGLIEQAEKAVQNVVAAQQGLPTARPSSVMLINPYFSKSSKPSSLSFPTILEAEDGRTCNFSASWFIRT